MKLILITADANLAARAEDAGVARIMVDLERLGKLERQMFRDTWISEHELADIPAVARTLSTSELMVRVNPLHNGTEAEVNAAIDAGAQLIMLPMFRTLAEVEAIGRMISGRCGLVPLVETAEAIAVVGEVAACSAVSEVFIGLNDLHLSLGLDFMFETLVNGVLDQACATLSRSNKPFGFGGVARIGEGELPAEFIMRQHAYLGSSRVILSRTFARSDGGIRLSADPGPLRREVIGLLSAYDEAQTHSPAERARYRHEINERVAEIVARTRASS